LSARKINKMSLARQRLIVSFLSFIRAATERGASEYGNA
jgi:hypothetical protein